MQDGRVHDDEIAGRPGHFLEPDRVSASPRLDTDQVAQVGGRGGEQASEPGVFGLEPIAHLSRLNRSAEGLFDLHRQAMRPRHVQCPSAMGQDRLEEGEDPQDGQRAEPFGSGDVQMPRRAREARHRRGEGHQRTAPMRGFIPGPAAKQGVGQAEQLGGAERAEGAGASQGLEPCGEGHRPALGAVAAEAAPLLKVGPEAVRHHSDVGLRIEPRQAHNALAVELAQLSAAEMKGLGHERLLERDAPRRIRRRGDSARTVDPPRRHRGPPRGAVNDGPCCRGA